MKNMIIKLSVVALLSVNFLSADKIDFKWNSPNNWSGGEFPVPTWFAKDMKVSGYEILHFHDGYYDSSSVGHWTYVFSLVVNELEEPNEAFLIDETNHYFLGLGRVLGDKKNPNLSPENITTKVSSPPYKSSYTGKVQNFDLLAYDSWESAKPIKLNTRIYTWLCQGSKHRAIVYAISPQPREHPIWDELTAEVHAFECQ